MLIKVSYKKLALALELDSNTIALLYIMLIHK